MVTLLLKQKAGTVDLYVGINTGLLHPTLFLFFFTPKIFSILLKVDLLYKLKFVLVKIILYNEFLIVTNKSIN